MNTTGSNLQQVQSAAGQKPVVKEPAAPATTHEAILAKRASQPHLLDPCSPQMVQTFAAPPPLLQKRSNVKRSYTSLIAMSPLESLLPPTSSQVSSTSGNAPQPFNAQTIEAALASQMTPSPVVDEVITDTKAVADLCSVLNADEGVMMTNPDAPSLARSTLYTERCVTAKDIIGAIDNYWGLEQLPNMELFSKE
ncbi:MAG: hypothetical protein HYX67_02045 [Candidatus Melainabacteria bacterium]|nr:hypothetical protein [Candidatus Melainabacteria bacterium]